MVFRLGNARGLNAYARPTHPQNFDQGQRARARIEYEAPKMVDDREQAIIADGVPVFIWRRTPGSLPCSCTSGARFTKFDQKKSAVLEPDGEVQQPLGDDDSTTLDNNEDVTFDDYVADDEPQRSPYGRSVDKPHGEDFPDEVTVAPEPTVADSGWLNRIVETGPFQTGNDIQCPVCFGSSYTDAWKPYKAVRLLGDFGSFADPSFEQASVDHSSHPSVAAIKPNGSITWQLAVPKWFFQTVRVQLWDGKTSVVGCVEYQADDGSWTLATPGRVDKLNGSGATRAWRVRAGDGPLRFTHLEVIILLEQPTLAAVPQLQIPFDADYVDYNVTIDMELSVDTALQEGEIVADSKHGRLWMASTVSTNRTADGQTLAVSPSFRSINSPEVYWTMNIYRQPDRTVIDAQSTNYR